MNRYFMTVLFGLLMYPVTALYAEEQATKRIEQFTNNKVKVWQTIIYPTSTKVLPMHRHDHERVLVALTDGVLKITNNKGAVHYLNLKKNKAYYLTQDVPGELHNDENMSNHPIKVMVIELN
ncbi:hypothetical protein [Legionella quateirensis]|uniref:Cupin domain n=1 Tax=Legionella quateirensis TaxID=45072 RepID=A0A378KTP2_9GAMM|nr:hypothetical protein [Legionella quateirensis]KTD44503.1 hypothetical protein Lqua_2907 [Legionella quateirensis]STY16991.1 Uncharacterised protein [Legionella quateirensis]